jgi:hypothetical protein
VLYIRASRSFVTEGLFGSTMARIQLVFLALLASSISVRAKSISYLSDAINIIPGEVQTDCESILE